MKPTVQLYFARNGRGKPLVYFAPTCDMGRQWFAARLREGARVACANGLWVSCETVKPDDVSSDAYRGECYAALVARILFEHEAFKLEICKGPAPKLNPSSDAPGFGYRLGGEIEKRLYVREPIPAPPKKTRTGRV